MIFFLLVTCSNKSIIANKQKQRLIFLVYHVSGILLSMIDLITLACWSLCILEICTITVLMEQQTFQVSTWTRCLSITRFFFLLQKSLSLTKGCAACSMTCQSALQIMKFGSNGNLTIFFVLKFYNCILFTRFSSSYYLFSPTWWDDDICTPNKKTVVSSLQENSVQFPKG